MMTAKLFMNGRSQAVRLPKECRFEGEEVIVHQIGEIVMLMPSTSKWDSFLQAIELFSDDFLENGREPQEIQEREDL